MKKRFVTRLLLTALIGLPLVSTSLLTACAPHYQKESTGQYLDSSVITTKVKAKLLTDKSIKSLPITVKTYKNRVQLSGFVLNHHQKNRAEELARSVPGVGDVSNSLIIKNQ